ncbi:DUF3159 domain-containing protein [Allostreptomyces psammosilenae]|uniref:Putative exporter n=1 Tax=Allostreptomyces psammosilenae TaxID=1892865 RepID=A0A852ZQL6_9ACTN|nr:DUF3159 domain-containing protein [Allostreptomyces psammosilenae]NYI03154.1 putative exporter [Allostreptomyces psammosilenae]
MTGNMGVEGTAAPPPAGARAEQAGRDGEGVAFGDQRPAGSHSPRVPAPPGEPPTETAAAAATSGSELIEAFGGVRGMVDMTVPGLVFVVVYTVTQNLTLSAASAFGLTVLLGLVRVFRRETLRHAFGGVLGVGIGAFVASRSGEAQDFYLPGMIYGVVLGVVYAVSNLVRWPLIGVLLGPVLGENFTWRTRNPGRMRAYTLATWVWVALFAVRAAILFPMYWSGNVTMLGVARVALGVPPWLVAIYLTWLLLSRAPAPIKDEPRDGAEAGGERPGG